MCGMSVVVALRGTSLDGSRSIATQLNESLERISHRGPDSRGTWVNDDQSVSTKTLGTHQKFGQRLITSQRWVTVA
jgi:asparagine synthetase B (glutamine-hydrolysing)